MPEAVLVSPNEPLTNGMLHLSLGDQVVWILSFDCGGARPAQPVASGELRYQAYGSGAFLPKVAVFNRWRDRHSRFLVDACLAGTAFDGVLRVLASDLVTPRQTYRFGQVKVAGVSWDYRRDETTISETLFLRISPTMTVVAS
jgi:hypothetical protein